MYRILRNAWKYRTNRFGKNSKTVLNIFLKIDAPVEPQNIETCYRLRYDNNRTNEKKYCEI